MWDFRRMRSQRDAASFSSRARAAGMPPLLHSVHRGGLSDKRAAWVPPSLHASSAEACPPRQQHSHCTVSGKHARHDLLQQVLYRQRGEGGRPTGHTTRHHGSHHRTPKHDTTIIGADGRRPRPARERCRLMHLSVTSFTSSESCHLQRPLPWWPPHCAGDDQAEVLLNPASTPMAMEHTPVSCTLGMLHVLPPAPSSAAPVMTLEPVCAHSARCQMHTTHAQATKPPRIH